MGIEKLHGAQEESQFQKVQLKKVWNPTLQKRTILHLEGQLTHRPRLLKRAKKFSILNLPALPAAYVRFALASAAGPVLPLPHSCSLSRLSRGRIREISANSDSVNARQSSGPGSPCRASETPAASRCGRRGRFRGQTAVQQCQKRVRPQKLAAARRNDAPVLHRQYAAHRRRPPGHPPRWHWDRPTRTSGNRRNGAEGLLISAAGCTGSLCPGRGTPSIPRPE